MGLLRTRHGILLEEPDLKYGLWMGQVQSRKIRLDGQSHEMSSLVSVFCSNNLHIDLTANIETSSSAQQLQYSPVLGDLKSGIPADVLIPGSRISGPS